MHRGPYVHRQHYVMSLILRKDDIGPTQNGDLHVFLPNESGSGTKTYGFSDIVRAEKRESHPFA